MKCSVCGKERIVLADGVTECLCGIFKGDMKVLDIVRLRSLGDSYSLCFGEELSWYYAIAISRNKFYVIEIYNKCPLFYDRDISIGILSKHELIDLLVREILECRPDIEYKDEIGKDVLIQALKKVCKILGIKPIYSEKEYKIKFRGSMRELRKVDSVLWAKVYTSVSLTSSELRRLKKHGFDYEILKEFKPELDIDRTYDKIIDYLCKEE